MSPQPQPKNGVQRIYIGGIQPPALTVEMVQTRLQSTLSNKIEFVSLDKSKSYTNHWGEDTQTFFFVTARSKMNNGDEENDNVTPPIDIVSQQYNNVKWKGCTLRVEKAKLHFLQRLEVEREEAEQARLKKIEMELALADETTVTIANKDVPRDAKKTKRHLRIRKRFGEEAYMVDTKPVRTDNQRDLHFSLKKQREKRKKHLDLLIQSRRKRKNQGEEIEKIRETEANFSLQSKVYLNRAIHIKFGDNGSEHGVGAVKSSIIYSDKDETQHFASENGIHNAGSSSGGEDSDSSVPSSSDEETEDDNGQKKNYDWSRDSDDESLSNVGDERNGDTIATSEELKSVERSLPVVEPKAPQKKEAINETEKRESDDDSEGYCWSEESDDDSSLGDIDDQETKYFDYGERKHNDLDEFVASFNDNTVTTWKYGEDDFACEDDADFQDEFLSLEDDVKSNLGMVGKLFPELLNTTPESFNEDGQMVKHEAPAGWDASGMMQRYDPFAASATNYEVKTEDPGEEELVEDGEHEGSESEDGASSSSSSVVSDEELDDDSDGNSQVSSANKDGSENVDMDDDHNDDKPQDLKEENNTIADQKEQVYEQKKLENIFQQERTGKGTTGFQMSSMFDQAAISKHDQSSSGGFSFSFQPSPQLENKEESSDVLENKDKHDDRDGRAQKTSQPKSDQPQPDVINLKKRRGLTFGKEELNIYSTQFFNANEGIDAILASMENPKVAEADQVKWDDERKVLTLDWKRKQKQAQSYKKKRLKLR